MHITTPQIYGYILSLAHACGPVADDAPLNAFANTHTCADGGR